MSILEAIVLGIVQGLTEFLPVSSSGHLQIAKEVLGVELTDNLTFDLTLHLATVMATVVVLWREVKGLFWDWAMIGKLALSAVPVAVVGLCFRSELNAVLSSPHVLLIVGAMLVLTAVLLWFASRKSARGGGNITYKNAFVIGVGQAFAALPGLSRSGTTIATGLLLGVDKARVAQFSFLMVIVPILGNAFLDVVGGDFGGGVDVAALTAGFLAAFVVGCFACRFMIEMVKRSRLGWFAAYCAVVGVSTIIYYFV